MLILSSTSDKLYIDMSESCHIDSHVSFMDDAAGVLTPDSQLSQAIDEDTKDICDAPAASVQRAIRAVHIYNAGPETPTVTVKHKAAGVTSILFEQQLAISAKIAFTKDRGWHVIDEDGNIRS